MWMQYINKFLLQRLFSMRLLMDSFQLLILSKLRYNICFRINLRWHKLEKQLYQLVHQMGKILLKCILEYMNLHLILKFMRLIHQIDNHQLDFHSELD